MERSLLNVCSIESWRKRLCTQVNRPMNSRYDTRWTPGFPARDDGNDGSGGASAQPNAAPPAAYFISVLELATGEKLGNDERLRAVAMLESQFGEGRPRTLKEAVRICAGAIDSSTLQRMARGAKA
ncbi:hypothetical protein [Caballeronia sp. GAWG2-1]|uniref:hypothetical protein n=1 Tax=Caballeronia sp. GAWG2-1 TaxID=2921744 RepID=UPI002027D852|nr:hypothetical protein [Caballeronia sp. GAWG2-1]